MASSPSIIVISDTDSEDRKVGIDEKTDEGVEIIEISPQSLINNTTQAELDYEENKVQDNKENNAKEVFKINVEQETKDWVQEMIKTGVSCDLTSDGAKSGSSVVGVRTEDADESYNHKDTKSEMDLLPASYYGVGMTNEVEVMEVVEDVETIQLSVFPEALNSINVSAEIFTTPDIDSSSKPIIYIDESLRKVIDHPQTVSILTSRGLTVSSIPGKEPGCIYCCFKGTGANMFSACTLVLDAYDFLRQVIANETEEYKNLVSRVYGLKKKYGSLIIVTIGLESSIKKAMSSQNTAFRQRVVQEPCQTRKRKYKKDTIREVDEILGSFGSKCRFVVLEKIDFFSLECEVSVINCTTKDKVVEWIGTLPKAVIKRQQVQIDHEQFPDKIFIPTYHKKHKRKGTQTEKCQIRNLLAWQLEEIDGLNEETAKAISKKYQSFSELRQLLSEHKSNGQSFLSSFTYRVPHTRMQTKSVGPLISKRLYKFLTSKDPDAFID
ncbi:hypothetical protein RF11_08973 [Thelohanellus kitauei]|uniref:Crossover junction endonuclease EME1 n=1 Tax=Thelohanellus kitauei TaxID=669202 RepID=A0A0C2J124_THEKT|nr:hypothetical protein RF11_08973 [Thelohanellus kitauei]